MKYRAIGERIVGRRRSRSSALDHDRDLFRRLLQGDADAFAGFFDLHQPRIFSYCVKMLESSDDAADITQEVWERLLRMRSGAVSDANPAGLLITMARNRCIDRLNARRSSTSLDAIPESDHPVTNQPQQSQLEELVVLSLGKLPFPQREVLVLHLYSGYSFVEISELLGESHQAVRMRASRARRHLVALLTVMLGIEEDYLDSDDSDSGRP